MGILSRKALRERAKSRIVEREIDGDTAWFRVLSGAERDGVAQAQLDGTEPVALMVEVAIRSLCDEHGKRMYEDDDVDEFRALPNDIHDEIVLAACEVNGLSKEGRDDLGKDSEPMPSGDSGSS